MIVIPVTVAWSNVGSRAAASANPMTLATNR